MIKYTFEEALLLAQMLHSEGHIAYGGEGAKTYTELLDSVIRDPIFGCFVYPIWDCILRVESKRHRSNLRRVIYKATRLCYMPLREVPLKLAWESSVSLYGIILKWRLGVGK
jgi:hypothetical protein